MLLLPHYCSVVFLLLARARSIWGLLVKQGVEDRNQSSLPFFRRAKLDRFIVVPEHKLLFCYIEKNGCTSFNRLFMNVRGQDGEGRLWFRNSPVKFGMTASDLESLMKNASWHRAVFYREPLERFVSAYRSKCESGHDRDGELHCERAFGLKNASFAEAVMSFVKNGGGLKNDAHFLRQAAFCGGLNTTLQYYDTVEQLDASTAHEKVSALLRKVGIDPARVKDFEVLFPRGHRHYERKPEDDATLNAIPGVTTSMTHHITNSHAKTRAYFESIPDFHITRLTGYFMPDYELFRMPIPEWVPDLTPAWTREENLTTTAGTSATTETTTRRLLLGNQRDHKELLATTIAATNNPWRPRQSQVRH